MKIGSCLCYFMSVGWFAWGSWQAYANSDSIVGMQRAEISILSGIWMLGVSFWLRERRP